jgi:hypothetical protein
VRQLILCASRLPPLKRNVLLMLMLMLMRLPKLLLLVLLLHRRHSEAAAAAACAHDGRLALHVLSVDHQAPIVSLLPEDRLDSAHLSEHHEAEAVGLLGG